jgi:hypothetical protein
MKIEFSRQILEKYIKVIKIRPVGAELLHVFGRTDTHEEANGPCLQF